MIVIYALKFVGLCVCILTAGLLAGVGDLNAVKILSPSSVLLTWTPPYTLDNVPISGYNVTTTRVHSGEVTHCIYNGANTTLSLSNTCEDYIFSVVAINAVGNGSPSTVTVNYLQGQVTCWLCISWQSDCRPEILLFTTPAVRVCAS